MSASIPRRTLVRALGGVAVAGLAVAVPAVSAEAARRRRPRRGTGTAGGRAEPGTSGTTSTATTRTVSGSTGGISTAGLTASSLALLADVRARYPQITSVGGVRPDALPDHPSGRALDFMMPNGTADKALGDDLAEYVRANAARLNVSYVIWRQRIWSVARAAEGWRGMANRGSATANHMDHVHVTVR